MEILKVLNLTKIYGKGESKVVALDDVSFTVEKGEFVAIVGTSGSGKSTLLHMLGGLDRPSSGKVFVDGKDIFSLKDEELTIFRRRKIGFVFQHFALMDYYTAYENIELPLIIKNIKRSERKRLVNEQLKLLGIEEVKDHIPSKMSGGQRQRVAIARALVSGCNILLADEPTGALDQATGREVMELLKEINKRGTTVIIVTHDINIANQTERIIEICDGKIKR